MVVNDDAGWLDRRRTLGFIASELAPTVVNIAPIFEERPHERSRRDCHGPYRQHLL